MGKLNIAHHKSYHPYRRDNIERVRKDEEEAKLKEEGEEGRMRLADSEARLDLLRGRSGPSKRVKKGDEATAPVDEGPGALTTISTSSGHINLFANFEQHAMSNAIVRTRELAKKGTQTDDEKGVRLAPSAKDLKPWYVDQESQQEEMAEEKRMRDLSFKAHSDPLTSIKSQLSRSYPSSIPPSSSRRAQPPPDTTEGRVQRESSERARAMTLIRRKKREREMGSMTPSSASVAGDDLDQGGYGDVYNRRETEDAHRRRDRGWGRGGGYDERRDRRDRGYQGRRW